MATFLEHNLRTTVQTTDATVTTCGSYTMADETTIIMRAHVIGRQTSSTNNGVYEVYATAKRESAGGATLNTGSPVAVQTVEDDATWACTIDTSGNDVRIRVTGVAATTINWTSFMEVKVYTP